MKADIIDEAKMGYMGSVEAGVMKTTEEVKYTTYEWKAGINKVTARIKADGSLDRCTIGLGMFSANLKDAKAVRKLYSVLGEIVSLLGDSSADTTEESS